MYVPNETTIRKIATTTKTAHSKRKILDEATKPTKFEEKVRKNKFYQEKNQFIHTDKNKVLPGIETQTLGYRGPTFPLRLGTTNLEVVMNQ